MTGMPPNEFDFKKFQRYAEAVRLRLERFPGMGIKLRPVNQSSINIRLEPARKEQNAAVLRAARNLLPHEGLQEVRGKGPGVNVSMERNVLRLRHYP